MWMMQGGISWESSGYKTSKHKHYLGNITNDQCHMGGHTLTYIERWFKGGNCELALIEKAS